MTKLSGLPTESTFGQSDYVVKVKAAGGGDVLVKLSDLIANGYPIILGYAQVTSSQATTSTSQIQVTGLTLTVTIPTGNRFIKITAGMFGYNANANDGYIFDIWDGPVNTGTQLQAAGMEKNSNPNATSCIAIAVVQPAAGPKTYNVGFRSSLGGTANTNAVAGEPAYLLVEAT